MIEDAEDRLLSAVEIQKLTQFKAETWKAEEQRDGVISNNDVC